MNVKAWNKLYVESNKKDGDKTSRQKRQLKKPVKSDFFYKIYAFSAEPLLGPAGDKLSGPDGI